MPSSRTATLYAEQLVRRGYGLPLWHPEPNIQDGEVQIGDVGFIDDGMFFRLFNATKPAAHEINARGVPAGYEPLNSADCTTIMVPNYLQGPICTTSISSQTVSGELSASTPDASGLYGSYTFKCESDRGALAFVRAPATLQRVVRSRDFVKYMLRNYQSWYNFASNVRRQYLSPEDIVFVYGYVKTDSWSLTAFDNKESRSSVLRLSASAVGAAAKFTFGDDTTIHQSPEQRHSRPSPILPGRICEGGNQCIFLQYYKLRTRIPFMPSRVRSGAKSGDARLSTKLHLSFGLSGLFSTVNASNKVHASSSSSRNAPSAGMTRRVETYTTLGGDISIEYDPDIDSLEEKTTVSERGELKAQIPSQREEEDGFASSDSDDDYDFRDMHDPVDDVLRYMLEREPSAKVVIAGHDDLYELCPPSSWPENTLAYLREQNPELKIKNHVARIRFAKSTTRHPDTVIREDVHKKSGLSDATETPRWTAPIVTVSASIERSPSSEAFSTPICQKRYGIDVQSRSDNLPRGWDPSHTPDIVFDADGQGMKDAKLLSGLGRGNRVNGTLVQSFMTLNG